MNKQRAIAPAEKVWAYKPVPTVNGVRVRHVGQPLAASSRVNRAFVLVLRVVKTVPKPFATTTSNGANVPARVQEPANREGPTPAPALATAAANKPACQTKPGTPANVMLRSVPRVQLENVCVLPRKPLAHKPVPTVPGTLVVDARLPPNATKKARLRFVVAPTVHEVVKLAKLIKPGASVLVVVQPVQWARPLRALAPPV